MYPIYNIFDFRLSSIGPTLATCTSPWAESSPGVAWTKKEPIGQQQVCVLGDTEAINKPNHHREKGVGEKLPPSQVRALAAGIISNARRSRTAHLQANVSLFFFFAQALVANSRMPESSVQTCYHKSTCPFCTVLLCFLYLPLERHLSRENEAWWRKRRSDLSRTADRCLGSRSTRLGKQTDSFSARNLYNKMMENGFEAGPRFACLLFYTSHFPRMHFVTKINRHYVVVALVCPFIIIKKT